MNMTIPIKPLSEPAGGATIAVDIYGPYNENMLVLEKGEDIRARRQQHRNVFAERCRLAGVRCPDGPTMLAWWPGTKSVFG